MRKWIPFLLIVVAAVLLLETQNKETQETAAPLRPPPIDLIALSNRGPAERDFALPDLSGNTVNLADFRGKPVLLNFFATWCAPCRDEMPAIEKLFQDYQNKGLMVLGISRDEESKKAVEPFAKEFQLTFPLLLDPDLQAFRLYLVRGVPVNYLIDKQGRIAGMHIGPADWNSPQARRLIERLLEES